MRQSAYIGCKRTCLLYTSAGKRQLVESVANYKVLTTSINYATEKQAFFKRTMDIVGGLVGCVLTAIIFVFVAPAIYIQSPGPIFFSQERVGKNGKKFKIYKFRSMYLDAEERKKELMAQNRVKDGMMFKLDFDTRVIGNKILPDGTHKTGIGNFLRVTSLDEFPQFYNVPVSYTHLDVYKRQVYGLRDAAERMLRFDIDIENHYAGLLRYYVCGLILKELGAKRVETVHAYRDLLEAFFDGEMEERQCSTVAEGSGEGEADPDRSGARRIYVVDDRHQATASGIFPLGEHDTAIFINSSDHFHMFTELDFAVDERQWRAVASRKELDEGSFLQNEWPEAVWICSRNPGTLKKIEAIKEEKRLKHVGVTLDVDCITDSQEMKIRILEGNLRASLARIEKYREEGREHLETIRNLEEQLRQQDQETVDLLAKALEERRRK